MIRWLSTLAGIIAPLLLHLTCAGQNLVPNPSFEQYNSCPVGISGVDYSPGYTTFTTVKSWVNPLQKGSADYFNTCAAFNSYVSVPSNTFGYQHPRTANGYIGLIAWEGKVDNGNMTNIFGEYVQCKLTQPMIAGASYCVTYYVSNGVSNATYNFVGIEKMGVNFSATKTSQPTGLTLSLPFSVANTGKFLTDTAGWTRVTGTYTATGGEEWMSMGWFDNGGTPAFQPITPAVPNTRDAYRCYLYIDDVSVVKRSPNDTIKTLHDSTYCTRGSLSLKLNSKTTTGDFKWNNGATGSSIIATDTGWHWCVAYADCVTYIDSFMVHYKPTAKLDLGKELVNCQNQPVVIHSNYPNADYLWSTGEKTPSITVTKPGKYKLTIDNACGMQTDSVQVHIQPPTPDPLPADTMVCQFTINPTVAVPGTNVKWYTHATGIIGSDYQPLIITKKPGLYSLYYTQTIGKCESNKVPVSINVTYTPHEELGDKAVMCDNDLKVIGEYAPDVTYKWNTGASTCCVRPDVEGMYKRATTNNCGSFIDTVWVYHNSCEQCIDFPNAFVPVRDGVNNVFRPLLKCPVAEFHMRIFNRWGNLVYESKDVNEGWHGRFNYEPAPIGTYVYHVEYRANGKMQKQVVYGNVTLLR